MKIKIIYWDSESILAEYQEEPLPEILGEFTDYRDVCETVLDEIDRIYRLSAGQKMAYMRHLVSPSSSEFYKEIQKKRKKHGKEK